MFGRAIKVLRFGRVPYRQAYQLQEHLVERIKQASVGGSIPCQNFLILLQHDPVYTTGMRTKEYTVEEETYLKGLGADFVRTNRGGLITFHGPGQLVAYPILNLNQFVPEGNRRKAALGMKWYVNTLEEVVIQVCKEFGIKGQRSPHTGVWVEENKICAMGVHSSQLVTSHGLALNCNTDLRWFEHIVPCGIVGKGVTSLTHQLGRPVTVQEAEPVLLRHVARQFSAQIMQCSEEDVQDVVPEQLHSYIVLS